MKSNRIASLSAPGITTRSQAVPGSSSSSHAKKAPPSERSLTSPSSVQNHLNRLNEQEIAGVIGALGATLRQPFIPIPGPQTEAFNSPADELLSGELRRGSATNPGLDVLSGGEKVTNDVLAFNLGAAALFKTGGSARATRTAGSTTSSRP